MKRKALTALQVAAIVIAGWVVYAPAFHGGWLWDDPADLSKNPVLRDPGGLPKIWLDPVGPDYFPLTSTVQWIQWHVWGSDPTGYHLTNVALHLAAALLFWRILGRLGVRLAWLGGLLFAVHPLAVESVAWVAELKNPLSLVLLLLAAEAYLDFDRGGAHHSLALALAGFLAAMLAKASVVMFPCVILLYAWWRRGRISWPDLRASAGFFAISLGLGLVTLVFQEERAMGGMSLYTEGLPRRLAASGMAAAFYLGKSLWPSGLLPVYPRWKIEALTLAQGLLWPGFLVLLWVCWARRASWGRHALLGLGFFLISLAPVLGILPMAYLRISWVADHLAYLPLLGIIGLAASALGEVRSRALQWAAGGAAILALAVSARAHARLFEGPATLWSYAVEHSPEAWVARNNLAAELERQGRTAEAIEQARAALEIRPDYVEALNTLGNALSDEGHLQEAADAYRRAAGLEPRYAEIQVNLGISLARTGRLAEAIPHLEQGVRLKPWVPKAHMNLGSALASLGRISEAIPQFEEALRLEPRSAQALFNLGAALAHEGRLEESISRFRQGLAIEPDNAAAHAHIAIVLRQAGRPEEALAEFAQAERLGAGR